LIIARSTYNVVNDYLLPNTTGAEGNVSYIDFLSNGFKIRSTSVLNIQAIHNLHGFCRTPIRYFNFYTNYGSLIMIALLHIINKNKIKDFKQVKQINTF
jgi:hypothetical protein